MYLYTNQNSKLVLTPFNNVLTSSSDITDSHAISLISRMTTSGETPTIARQIAINNCIVALKAGNLFENQFDVLVTTRSHGRNSAKMNWIKTGHTATESSTPPTFTTDIGFNSNGSSSYLDTNYKPSTQAVIYTLNNCCFGFKDGGTVLPVTGALGGHGSPYPNCMHLYYNIVRANELNGTIMSNWVTAGYHVINRTGASSGNVYYNNGSLTTNIITSTTSLPSFNFDILRTLHSSYSYTNVERINEMYWMGKNMSLSQFNTFQSIMNNYFSTF